MFEKIFEKWTPLREREKEKLFNFATILQGTSSEIQHIKDKDFTGEMADVISIELQGIAEDLKILAKRE